MNYTEFKQAVIAAATEKNVKDYELYYTESAETQTEIFKEEVKGFKSDNSLGVCFKCLVNGKMGYASTEHLSPEEAVAVVERALENAGSIESEEASFIHTKGDEYQTYEKKEEKEASSNELIDFALELQKELYATDNRVVDGTQAVAAYVKQKKALYNSNGLDLEDEAAFALSYGMAVIAEGEEMYDGMEVVSGEFSDFDKKEIAKEAVKDALETVGAAPIPSGKYPVVFSNKVMASLLSTYAEVFSAEQAQKGLSLLKGKEGETVASSLITLVDDPMYKDALVKCTFDAEGVATYKKTLIEKGVFKTLLYNLKTAAVAGVKSTGNAAKASYASVVDISPYSFYIEPGEGTLEDVLAKAGNGVYITSLQGMHAGANAVTGDFSLAASGFQITDGKKGAPVKSITVSGNFFDVLKDITVVGGDLKFNPFALGARRPGSPSVLVKEMTIAGK